LPIAVIDAIDTMCKFIGDQNMQNVSAAMPLPSSHASHSSQQLYLVEKDTGIVCRLLGLYAARGIEIDYVHYEHAAPRTAILTVRTVADQELLRVLVEKAGSFVGVIEAAEQTARHLQAPIWK
jgi:hypothetical protein